MNILISNIYSWQNKGDAGIVIAMLEDIKNQFPDATIYLSSYDEEDKGKYGDYGFYNNTLALFKKVYKTNRSLLLQRIIYSLRFIEFRIKLYLLIVLMKFNIFTYWLFPDVIANKIKSYEIFDLVIACGGGYIMTSNKSYLTERIFMYRDVDVFCYDFYLAKLFNKPYLLYNQSVGPFYNKKDEKIILKHLYNSKIIICREEITYSRLQKMGLKNILLGADIAFKLKSSKCDILNNYNYSKNNLNIGITVRDWLTTKKQNKYELEIANFINTIIKIYNNANIYFMPQVIFERSGDNDLKISKRILNKIQDTYKYNIHVITEDLHPSELKYVISKMNYFIGTRMHSNIYSLSSYVKTIAIAYELKTIGIMEMLNLKHYTIPMSDLTKNLLLDKFHELKNDKEYQSILLAGLNKINNMAYVNIPKYINRPTVQT
jgi:colanic acid/amylovoran biosynthesis protein